MRTVLRVRRSRRAYGVVLMSDSLRIVAQRHQLAKELRQQADKAQAMYVEALRKAIKDGHSVVECATAAGLGRHAVYAALRRRNDGLSA